MIWRRFGVSEGATGSGKIIFQNVLLVREEESAAVSDLENDSGRLMIPGQ
jgi:hypothetical protein